jgi:hypothetical protein
MKHDLLLHYSLFELKWVIVSKYFEMMNYLMLYFSTSATKCCQFWTKVNWQHYPTDNNKQMYVNIESKSELVQFDYINWMITLSEITLSGRRHYSKSNKWMNDVTDLSLGRSDKIRSRDEKGRFVKWYFACWK